MGNILDRIAWVELDENARDMTAFVQTVLANRGLPGLLFETEEEARKWLLEDRLEPGPQD